MHRILLFLAAISLLGCKPTSPEEATAEKWVSLFNGKDLSGWTPKFAGSEFGVNYKNTFRVSDGVIQVNYEEYDTFNEEFGHLFYKDPFDNYHLRLEYRFLGEQVPNGPGWAFKNSGVMLHCQAPETMEIDQDFPQCIEAQFLGGSGEEPRPTGNLCTPGTHVYLADTLTTTHCINSTSATYATEDWVRAELIVYGDSLIHHLIEGDTVMTYTRPVTDDGVPVGSGYISLQAESHPLEFRNIEIRSLSR